MRLGILWCGVDRTALRDRLATDRTEALVRKIVLIADLVALIGAAMWFGSYRWWMFYGFLAAVVVIEISCKYLKELQAQSRDDE